MPSPPCPVTVFGWWPTTSTFTFRAVLPGHRALGASAPAAAPNARYGCLVSWSANRGQGVIVQSHASLRVRDAEIFELEAGC